MDNPILEEVVKLPRFTRFYLGSIVIVALLCHVGLVNPLSLYLNSYKIIHKMEIWRLLTCFLYFGPVNFDFIFHLFFLYRYSRSLEADSYFQNPADFFILCGFGFISLLIMASIIRLTFLGPPFTFMLVYIWCRKNPSAMMSFLGFLNFRAPMMPWVLFSFSLLVSGAVPTNDFLGIMVGHCYFFLHDVFPKIYRYNPLEAPIFLYIIVYDVYLFFRKKIFNRSEDDIIN